MTSLLTRFLFAVYLHIQAPTLVRGLASGMLAAGEFSFLPETRQSCLVNDEQTDGLYKD